MPDQTPPVFDGHNDVLLRLWLRGGSDAVASFMNGNGKGQLDLPRARAGGFAGGMFAIFVPSPQRPKPDNAAPKDVTDEPFQLEVDLARAQKAVLAMASLLFRIESQSNGQVRVCRTADEIRTCIADGVLAPVLHISWWGAWPWGPVQLVVLVVLFCAAGVRHPRPVLAWIWALTLAGFWLHGYQRPGLLSGVLVSVALTAAAVAVDAAGSRRRAQQAAAGEAERAELEQARRTVLEERAKIAREMHDVVAHHMSLIAVRAETAPYRLPGLPAPVAEEFGALSAAAREALADMRRLLGVLRQDEPAALAPQPQLTDLPVLVEAARQAGVTVALSSPPACDRVPAGVGVCAYRIVQESLSNASRHAPGAPVTVSVDHDAGAVLLRVANGPGQSPEDSWPTAGAGQGLAGMRERVALLGGSLSAGRSPDGGFVVAAVLPVHAAA